MQRSMISRTSGVRVRLALPCIAAFTIALAGGCEKVTAPLLKATDPDIINPADLASPDGAEALRIGALGRLTQMTTGVDPVTGNEGVFLLGGLLADEWRSGDTFQQRNETDQRNIDSTNSFMNSAWRTVGRARVSALQALGALRQYKPAPKDYQGQMWFVVGFAENQAAEAFCSGIPFSNGAGATPVYGDPLTTDQAFTQAAASFDSALANAPDTLRFRYAAMVGKGRALLNLGRYADAAAAVATVPASFTYTVTHSLTTSDNANWALNNNIKRYVVANLDGGTGLNFVAAADPRLPTQSGGNTFEGKPGFVAQLKFARSSPTVIVSGTEAKLIIAEAQLAATPTDTTTWLRTLNTLRSGAGLAPLTDPGTAAGRVDLLFRERAFWMWGTGHRQGDLRRLIRQYQRAPDSVFPTGAFPKGGNYGTDVALPIPTSERNNPKYTSACVKSQA
ncbi:MAG TPA: hypothetical protein VF761_18895 [Gemmatimonadaceae bacterium]